LICASVRPAIGLAVLDGRCNLGFGEFLNIRIAGCLDTHHLGHTRAGSAGCAVTALTLGFVGRFAAGLREAHGAGQ
jgi:hypothetical protein